MLKITSFSNIKYYNLYEKNNMQKLFHKKVLQAQNNTDNQWIDKYITKLKQQYQETDSTPIQGKVFLVGTGPGDPDLITLKALKILQQADVILYDRLVQQEVLNYANKSAIMIYVGKQRGFHTRTQDEIMELLRTFAQSGAKVARVKGGDPFIFGRGGEEMQHLIKNGVDTECIPGISAASGVCAQLGIPQTHRGISYSVRYLSGHAQDGSQEYLDKTIGVSHDPYSTLVIYMGLSNLHEVSNKLKAAGLTEDTPVCVVENGTTEQQRTIFGTLQNISNLATAHNFISPSLIVVGQAVSLSPFCHQGLLTGQKQFVEH